MGQAKIKKRIGELEFVALMAFLMSNVALCIDTILPALPVVGDSMGVYDNSQLQLIIFTIFLGLGTGELFFGTLSDSFGRKPIIYIGVGIYILASILIVFAPNFELLLIGRVIQGIGLSAPRSVSIAIIRDTYEGDRMARIMSFITIIFILVPMIAPLLGQLIINIFEWQAIFYFQILFMGITIIWFTFRQGESLVPEKRIKLSSKLFSNGLKEYFKYKNPILFTIVAAFLNGAFITYLASSQQIFQDIYGMEKEFPYIFGGLAFSFGFAALMNANLVMRFGMMRLVRTSLYFYMITAFGFFIFAGISTNPLLPILLVFLALQFLSLGFISGNLSSLAMQEIGHIAGIGAALYSFLSMVIGVVVAIIIGSFIEDKIFPLFVGFLLSGIVAFFLIRLSRHIPS